MSVTGGVGFICALPMDQTSTSSLLHFLNIYQGRGPRWGSFLGRWRGWLPPVVTLQDMTRHSSENTTKFGITFCAFQLDFYQAWKWVKMDPLLSNLENAEMCIETYTCCCWCTRFLHISLLCQEVLANPQLTRLFIPFATAADHIVARTLWTQT